MTFTDFNNQRVVLNRRIVTRQDSSGGGGGGGGGSTAWGGITGSLSSQTDLQSALNAKAASTHSHSMSDVTGLAAALAAKQDAGSYAPLSHTHIIADVTGLQTALDNKAPLGVGLVAACTLILPAGKSVYEHTQTFTDALVSPGEKIIVSLAPALDTDENTPEMLSLEGLAAVAGSGNFTVTASFRERTSGPVKLNYMVG